MCNLVASRTQPSITASPWRLDRGRHGKLSGCCAHCLSPLPKEHRRHAVVLSHLNALRQILFLADRVEPRPARPCWTGLLTIRHSVKFPLRVVEAEGA